MENNKNVDSKIQLKKYIINQLLLIIGAVLVVIAYFISAKLLSRDCDFCFMGGDWKFLVIVLICWALIIGIIASWINNSIKILQIKEKSSLKILGVIISIVLPLSILSIPFIKVYINYVIRMFTN